MKYRLLSVLAGVAFGSFVLQADVAPLAGGTKVQFNDLPPAAQNAIKAQAGSAQIEDIDKGTLNGRTVYEAAFKRDGQHTELRVAEDGTIIDTVVAGKSIGTQQTVAAAPALPTATAAPATPQSASASGGQEYNAGFNTDISGGVKVSWNEVPANVQKIIQDRAKGARVEDIDKGRGPTGHTVYQAAYKKAGQHVELRVTEDGKFVREVANGKTIYSTEKSLVGFMFPLSGAQTIAFRDAPASVRQIALKHSANARIDSVQKGTVSGKTMYHFSYTKNGEPMVLRVSEDGAFVREVAAKNVNEAAGAQRAK